VKNELETTLGILSGKGKGIKGKGPRGAERRKLWDEVKALRKESAVHQNLSSHNAWLTPMFRYRRREGGVVKSVLSESQVVLATCHSSGGRQLRNHDFDVVIIDEATQALEAVSGPSFVASTSKLRYDSHHQRCAGFRYSKQRS